MINVLLDDMAGIEDYLGMGFIFIKNIFSSSLLAINYFVKKFLAFILVGDGKDRFEKYLHNNYRSYESERDIKEDEFNKKEVFLNNCERSKILEFRTKP